MKRAWKLLNNHGIFGEMRATFLVAAIVISGLLLLFVFRLPEAFDRICTGPYGMYFLVCSCLAPFALALMDGIVRTSLLLLRRDCVSS